MSKAFALDLAAFELRSNTIAPTFIETPLTRPFFEDETFRTNVLAKIKLGRIGQVEDLMGAVLYLASDASSLVTVASLLVDGGWTAEYTFLASSRRKPRACELNINPALRRR